MVATTATLPLRQPGPNLLAHFYENLAEHVFASVVGATAPIIVVRRRLDQLLVAGAQEDLLNIVVREELGQDRFAHHVIFDLLPIGAQRPATIAPHLSGLFGGLGALHQLLVRGAREFLGLKVVLAGRPPYALQLDAVGREVREAAICVACAIEIDRHDNLPPSLIYTCSSLSTRSSRHLNTNCFSSRSRRKR